jgi:hypothetical protein
MLHRCVPELYMKLHHLASLASLTIVLVGCGDDDQISVEPVQTALVRVVNASTSTASADVFVGNQTTALGTGIASGTAGASCFNIPVGSQALSFRQTGSAGSIATAAPFTFVAGQRYTVILTGAGTAAGARSAVVLADNSITAPVTGQNAIRFFNATASGADVYVTAPNVAAGSASQTGLASGTATTGGTGGFTSYPIASTLVRAFAAGSPTSGTPAVSFTIPALPGNRIATVVLTGGPTGSQAFVVTPCE